MKTLTPCTRNGHLMYLAAFACQPCLNSEKKYGCCMLQRSTATMISTSKSENSTILTLLDYSIKTKMAFRRSEALQDHYTTFCPHLLWQISSSCFHL